ncbi:MAG TPA: undecaprenyldiphospho-muramoylpentapeptide beta-N-acetylglucosaminyltransferase [Candidatus Paceibacterota bacterium]
MKILFTGGGSGGHFYPIIAVAEEINRLIEERHLLKASLYYLGPSSYDERALFENNIEFRASPAGKLRRYFSLLNITDLFKTSFGVLKALFEVWSIYPDVIFSKGGYASFPTVLAAKLLKIPLIIHESDSVPGKVNAWAGKFARRIAISYPEAASYFPSEKTALVGNPVRRMLQTTAHEGAYEFLKLSTTLPVILILGGSQGAEKLNDVLLGALPELVERYQVIHQTGEKLFVDVERTYHVVLEKSPHADRYKVFPYLNELALRMSAGAASLVVSRAGSGAIFEIAGWGVPSIIIPLPTPVSHDQEKNAFTYARSGAGIVIAQGNLTSHLLVSEIDRLIGNPTLREQMSLAAKHFAKPDAARKIAEAIIDIGLKHETL